MANNRTASTRFTPSKARRSSSPAPQVRVITGEPEKVMPKSKPMYSSPKMNGANMQRTDSELCEKARSGEEGYSMDGDNIKRTVGGVSMDFGSFMKQCGKK